MSKVMPTPGTNVRLPDPLYQRVKSLGKKHRLTLGTIVDVAVATFEKLNDHEQAVMVRKTAA